MRWFSTSQSTKLVVIGIINENEMEIFILDISRSNDEKAKTSVFDFNGNLKKWCLREIKYL